MPKDDKAKKPVKPGAKKEKTLTAGGEYIKQKFDPKALALIHKFNLHTNPPFAKLIQTYQNIVELGKKNPRYKELTKMWEDEYNFLFEGFWREYKQTNKKQSTSKIAGWQNRLNIKTKEFGSTVEDKKLLFMQKIQPSFTTDDKVNSKKDILERAGFKTGAQQKSISFTAESKTKNLNELENLINEEYYNEKTADFSGVELFKANKKTNDAHSFDDVNIDTKPDPSLSEFLNEKDKTLTNYKDESEIEYSGGNAENQTSLFDDNFATLSDPVSNETDRFSSEAFSNNDDSVTISQKAKADEEEVEKDTDSLRDLIQDDKKRISHMRSNIENKFEESNGKKIIPTSALAENNDESVEDLSPDFYRNEFQKIYEEQSGKEVNYGTYDEDINFNGDQEFRVDYSKRNILSKEDFVYENKKHDFVVSSFSNEKSNINNRPYHEIKPVGVYDMQYDPEKRPSTIQNMYFENVENQIDDELQRKIKILRDLKDQRRHRINMFRIEKSNSAIIARAIEFRNKREVRMERRRNMENLRAIERIEKLRRLQERQRLVNLLKQRQLKLEEEKRVAQQIKLERQKNIEREAQYRMDLASIESQIHREMELIKNIELKTKAQYLKNHESEIGFEESMKYSQENKFDNLIGSINKEDEDSLEKNKEKIEQISLKFKKNL